MTAPRILFVDDDSRLLASLRSVLYRDRQRWQMVFKGSGEEALAEIRECSVDVIVSDMRMPGMDGAELLARVAKDWPQTRRILLSGSSDVELVAASAQTDELLKKPCDSGTLRATIERLLATPR